MGDRQVSLKQVLDTLETVGYDFSNSELSETELAEVCEAVGDVRQDMINRISRIPSAQPEPCEDAVSRHRLLNDLEELTTAWEKYPVMEEQIKGVETAIGYVKTIPSVTPKEQRWIPCSERLPEEYGNYLITTHDGNVDIGTIDPKKKGVWSACDADGFYWLREVNAWMPLPEPYREEGGE